MAIPLSPRAWAAAAAAMVAAGILLLAVQAPQARPQPHHAASRDAAAAPAPTPATAVANPCPSSTPIQLANIMPTSFVVGSQQIGADCMAWQEFIALNWPTGTGETFGNPANANPTVWETYQEAEALFNAPAGARVTASPQKTLFHLSELADVELKAIGQAGNGKWLTTQTGQLTYYEVRLNPDEVAFIQNNIFNGSNLTTFAGQAACAASPGQNGKGGFNLPQGSKLDTDCAGAAATYGADVGAIELKASWVALPANHSLDYRYLTAQATIIDPYGNKTQATVGLTGLHIIHKVPNAPQFIWATFEQIDNDPNGPAGQKNRYSNPVIPPNPNQQPSPGYTYYNVACNPSTDHYQCIQDKLPGTPCTTPPPNPQPAGCDPYSAPGQVTRVYAVDSNANNATGYAWSLMPANSVFNYYRLIEVQWPNQPSQIPPQSQVPLTPGDITPSDNTLITANTTAETYVQTTLSCMDCHKNAPIAQPSQQQFFGAFAGSLQRHVVLDNARKAPGAAAAPNYSSDYAFVFSSNTTH